MFAYAVGTQFYFCISLPTRASKETILKCKTNWIPGYRFQTPENCRAAFRKEEYARPELHHSKTTWLVIHQE